MMIVDRERLAAYRELLARPTDPTLAGRFGHHVTAPASPTLNIDDLKAQFVRHLMYRQLDREGDL
jgi:hypothetical protein